MFSTYPVILTPTKEGGFVVYIPDFDNYTEGNTLGEAIEMAADAIGMLGIVMQDDGKDIPTPSQPNSIKGKKDDIVTLVNIDFDEYRRKNDMRTVKKNCTIPSWLAYEAEKAGINFSQILQRGLKVELKL
ncbi:MAG: type II toxin-antitoxin system HicB family antitoxin [Clostridia bacterium]|nr:type II toxin-antitoxin system HicB family antitoxin [Clostridia bacterium]